MPKPQHVLQNFILPVEQTADRLSLYARWPAGGIHLAVPNKGMTIEPGSTVDFATFFNGFSHRKWRDLTGLKKVSLRIAGSGKARVVVQTYNRTAAAWILVDRSVTLSGDGTAIAVPPLADIAGEMLAVEVSAIGAEARILSLQWVTDEAPKRPVTLAAVITTFKREAQVMDAIERFATRTIPGAGKDNLHLFVIDNGQTVKSGASEHVTIIPNRNLGGAGGFARGLIEAKKAGRFTHVLFMDDDASCEPESVWRTMALLSRLVSDKASVAGAMLYADKPTIQYEKGATIQLVGGKGAAWAAHNHYWDLRDVAVVVNNDGHDFANYGGWWFFAFPLEAISHLPFPFFVRGDDTDFSLINRLSIVTLNGVATWCENFGYKLVPQTEYLAARSWMALTLTHGDQASARKLLRQMLIQAFFIGARFDYACMEAILDGLEHAAQGPNFFGSQPAPIDILSDMKQRIQKTTVSEKQFSSLIPVYWGKLRLRKWLHVFTFAGLIIPQSKLHSDIPHTRIAWELGRWTLLRASAVATGVGSDLSLYQRDNQAWLRGLKRIMSIYFSLSTKIPTLAERYRTESDIYRSEKFWESLFKDDDPKYLNG